MAETESPVEFEVEEAASMEDFTEDSFENDVEMGLSDEFSNRGRGAQRGSFRGSRGWMGAGPPPRFRGRGFGPGGPPPGFRGRGPPPPGLYGRGGPPPQRAGFNGPPNFNGPNWAGGPPPMGGPPPLLRPPGSGPSPERSPGSTSGKDGTESGVGGSGAPPQFPPPGMLAPSTQPSMINYPNTNTQIIEPNQEIWVETKSGEGKSYYYHARTRETTWTLPEGANVKVISQDQVEAMAQAATATTQLTPGTTTAAQAALAQASISNKLDDETKHDMSKQQASMGANGMQPPPGMMQGPPPGQMSRYGGPPGGQFPPFGMPPPGFPGGGGHWGPGAPPPWATGMPPGPAPWMTPGMIPPPIHVIPPSAAAAVDEAAVMSKIDPEIIAKATEWTEHKAPDGRFYYYHGKRGESVWEKPQDMKDLETAKLAAQQGISTRPKIETGNIEEMLANKQQEVKAFELAKQKEAEEERKRKQQQQEEDAVRKKKDDDEKAKEQKAQDKSRPVSSTPVPGTPWCVVWTGDGRVFFYNPSSRTSVWERPEDLIGRSDVDKMVATAPDAVMKDAGGASGGGKASGGADGVVKVRKRSDSDDSDSDVDVPSKKVKKEDGAAANGVQLQAAKKIDIGKDSAMEAEVKAAKERALIPLDTRIRSFKEMLAEKEVSAFSTWEKELHKIVFDQRYLLLTSKERKQVFERYVKERAEDERREKRNKLREKKDLYRKMLAEAHLHGKSVFSDFAIKYVKDDRFKGVEKMRERESLFNEYLIDVRRREKEEKMQRREQVKKDYFALLREHPDIDRHARWQEAKKKFESDARYKAVESSSQREEWFREHGKILKDEKKKAKEKEKQEHKREKDKDKHKKKDKENDKQGKERKKSESGKSDKSDRAPGDGPEDANASVVSSTAAKDGNGSGEEQSDFGNTTKEGDPEPEVEDITSDDDKQIDGVNEADAEEDGATNELKEKERQARAETSMREREKEVQRTLATHMRDRDKEREQHKRDESIQHFNALLADLVRNVDGTWREVKRVLRKDHRWDLAEALQREEREKLYGEHVEQLMRKKRDKFRELLDETSAVTLTSTWKEIKKVVKEDPRYTKFASSERCEREFKDYLKDKLIAAKGQFKELLQETKLITHKSLTTLRESQGHMSEIEEILKNDKRFLVLDHIPQERTQLVLNYLEELDRRGPPPPPTASEPTRRSKM